MKIEEEETCSLLIIFVLSLCLHFLILKKGSKAMISFSIQDNFNGGDVVIKVVINDDIYKPISIERWILILNTIVSISTKIGNATISISYLLLKEYVFSTLRTNVSKSTHISHKYQVKQKSY